MIAIIRAARTIGTRSISQLQSLSRVVFQKNPRCVYSLYLGAVGYVGANQTPTGPQNPGHAFQDPNMLPGEFISPTSGLSWNEFCYQMLARGEVERLVIMPHLNRVNVILYDGAIINGRRQYNKLRVMNVPDVDAFEAKVREFEANLGIQPENGVTIVYERNSDLGWILGLATTAAIIYFISRGMMGASGAGGGPQNILSQFSKAKFTLVDPLTRAANKEGVRFKDVAGLQEAKIEIQEFVNYLKKPEKFVKLGAKLPKGVLLLGPPGCGKTLLAKAVATEADVPFLALAGSDFVEMIGGVGAARVRDLFKQARKVSPCIIYIDEIDALGRKRSNQSVGSNREEEQTLNQLLVEMDGMSSRQGVILLASTNRADVLDSALLRPGRFDRHILIDYPNLRERREIFLQHVSKIKLNESADAYATRIAQLTARMSGADIANVCNEAALHAARKNKKSVSHEDLEYAVERVVGGTEKRSAATSPAEKKIIAYHESGHALVSWLLENTDAPLKVSIVPRTTNALGLTQYLPSDQKLYTTEQIFDRMCMALGGRVAEMLIFNHLSTGSQDDLKKVTKMALAQIKHYGMDPVVGNLSFPVDSDSDRRALSAFGIKTSAPYSKRMASLMEQRAMAITSSAFKRTEQLLKDNLDKLKLLANALLEKEVINYSDIERMIGPPAGKKRAVVDYLAIDLPLTADEPTESHNSELDKESDRMSDCEDDSDVDDKPSRTTGS